MNQLRHLKQYQSAAEDGPDRAHGDGAKNKDATHADKNQARYANRGEGQESLDFIDLSNIHNISDLNQLEGIQNSNIDQDKQNLQSPLNVENIAVDLDEDELEQMQRMINRDVYDKKQPARIDSQDRGLDQLQDYMMNTPPSDFSENEHKKKQIHQHQDQIQQELRQLLAQSPTNQILLMNEDMQQNNQMTSSEERELRRKWLNDNGLFSHEPSQPQSPEPDPAKVVERDEEITPTQFYPKQQDRSIEMGEQPLDLTNKDLLNEEFDLVGRTVEKEKRAQSPPKVAPKAQVQVSQKPASLPKSQNFKSSPKNVVQNQDLALMVSNSEKGQFQRNPDAQLPSPKEGANPKGKDVEKAIDQSNGDGDENDSFHRLYNKEIKVNQDEIPLLLLELTDIAFKFIKKDQFEKAYVLLQKTESVLEVVNLDHSKRDRYFAYITYLNMAMCFQKLGMLEECIIYLKETIQVIEKPNFFKDVSISQRMKQMHMQCQLKLQLCAILSQTQKHTEAMENAKTSVRLAHQILRDMYDLCVFYSNKIKFKDDFASLSLLLMEEAEDGSGEQSKAQNASKCYQDGYQNSNRAGKPPKHSKSEINEKMFQKQFIRENSPVRDIPFNILEESISMIERTALKMLPIMKELGNRLAGTTGKKGLQAFHTITGVDSVDTKSISVQKQVMVDHLKSKMQNNDKGLLIDESEEKDIKDVEVEIKDADKKGLEGGHKAEDQVDMRTVLGFLNQNEWILNLNIGNIMQIQPVRMRDFLSFSRNEHQLSRESFLEKLQLLVVSYFCVSTELRFIIQSRAGFMKPETKKEKELEQEYWHVKALDIACAFLPSECPLFNHILLSYQKHHDPAMQPIDEDKEQEDTLAVLRPLKGIENSKYQPIVREVENVYIDIPEMPLSPLSKCFDQRLMPKKTKTTSIDIQTEAIQEPEPPLMKSQSISVQSDLKLPEVEPVKEKEKTIENPKEKSPKQIVEENKRAQTISDVFDVGNAYMDLSSSKYQESLISKIIDDPKIDTQNFLNQLITRVNSSDPEHFALLSRKNTQNQGFGSNFYQQTTNEKTNMHTLSDHIPNSGIIDDAIYGSRQGYKQTKSGKGLLVYKTKNTQSGQLTKKRTGHGLDDLQHSFEHNSQQVKNHQRSLYRDHNNSHSDAIAIGGNVKHHIASQSLAPSSNVFTEQKQRPKSGLKQSSHAVYHKKNQSISGPNLAHDTSCQTQDMFTKTHIKQKQTMEQKFNNSVNSNLSKGTRMTKKKNNDSKIQEQRMVVQARQASSKEKQFSKINLSNEKGKKGPVKYQTNAGNPKGKDRSGSKHKNIIQKQPSQPLHKVPTSKTEHSIIKQLDDVMSSSYSQSPKSATSPISGADPDLLQPQFPSQPEDSLSEMNKTNPTNKSLQSIPDPNHGVIKEQSRTQKQKSRQKEHQVNREVSRQRDNINLQVNQHQEGQNQPQIGKTRPSSAITNYTSGQSGVRMKMNAKRLQQCQNQRIVGKQQRIQQLQQSQNIVQSTKQSKQKHLDNGIPIVPKKKSKVLSRKKYGSDQSSDSPPPHGASQIQHGYSIAHAPLSIFDSGNSHSISKLSNMQNSKTHIQPPEHIAYHYNDSQSIPHGQSNHQQSLKKQHQMKQNHANSQTIHVQMRDDRAQKRSKHEKASIIPNQSEDNLGKIKMQNLLGNKISETKLGKHSQLNMKSQKHSSSQYNGQYLGSSNPRKQAQSIGSLGYSQTRQSRFSQNSKKSGSRKSRYSRSKSSRKSASKSKSKSNKQRSQSNERSLPQFVNKSHQDVSPQINQSQIVMSNNFLDSDIDARNHASFELRQLLHELHNNNKQQQTEVQPKKKYQKGNLRGQRPKSSLLFEHPRESLQNSKKVRSSVFENLQRQLLENQKILLSNLATQARTSQKKTKYQIKKQYSLTDESKFFTNKSGNTSQQINNKIIQQKQVAPLSNTSLGRKKTSSKVKRERQAKQQQFNTNQLASQNSSHRMGLLSQATKAATIGGKNKANMMNLKMTQQHLSQGLKLSNMMEGARGGNSTTASTTGANMNNFQSGKSMRSRKQMVNQHKRKQSTSGALQQQHPMNAFVNFEQMQQQLENDMQLGGVDLQQNDNISQNIGNMMQLNTKEHVHMNQFSEQQLGFVPLKNMMPKTTGSQAHLLNIQQQQQQEAASAVAAGLSGCVSGQNLKSFNSLNQTGRANNAFYLNHGQLEQMLINKNNQLQQ